MKEKLIIRNFGPIKSIELELGRFNVLIGENATGKSTVARVLAVCRYFPFIVGNDTRENAFQEGLIYYGLTESIQSETFISYECEHYLFNSKRYAKAEEEPFFSTDLKSKSQEFENLLKELKAINSNKEGVIDGFYGYYDPDWSIPTSFIQNDVAAVMDKTFFVPTQRGLQSLFSLGKNSIQNLSDALFDQLAQLDQIARSFKNETAIDPLGITYKNEDGRGYIKKDSDDKYYSLFNAASGYQSTIPIVLLVKYYSESKKKSSAFLIEEPELNLFPKAQHQLMQYLTDKTINYGNNILLTTHSPYTLTVINNIMYAYKVGQSHNDEANNIISRKNWLNPDDVSVYIMLTSGECEDIFDREEGLIKAEKIDGVTNVLNNQFSELLNLEFLENEFNTH